jgi:hypothetical protein
VQPDRNETLPKTFKDFSFVAQSLKKYQKAISKTQVCKDFKDLPNLYLEGQSKLKNESESAARVPQPLRRLIVLNESIGKQVSKSRTLKV